MLLWKRYGNNKIAAILHLQQYSRRLNFFYFDLKAFLFCSIIKINTNFKTTQNMIKGKGKAVPLQACSCPEGSSNLSFPDFMTTAQDGSKFVSLTH